METQALIPAATPDGPGARPGSPGTLAPVAPGERIAELDILRGFALLGICVINIEGFYAPYFLEAAGEDLYPARVDRAAVWLVGFLGSGKFNSMFSFLFGVGFAIQMGRAAAKGAPFVALYLRRLLVLFLFGLAHILLFWEGDVLHIYAILGLPLLEARRLRDGWLWAIAAALLVVPIVYAGSKLYRHVPDPHTPSYYRERGEEQLRVLGRGPFDDLLAGCTKSAPAEPRPVVGRGEFWPTVRHRARVVYEDYAEHEGLLFWAALGTTMTVGFLVGRHRVFEDLPAYLPAIRRAALWTGVVGVGLAAGFATVDALAPPGAREPTVLGFAAFALYMLNRPVLCAFYVCGIVLLAQRPGWRRAMGPLAIVGRMPLTNYLMQSVIHSLLFFGYGFGLFARVTPVVGVLIALATYAVQVVYSNLWMSRFRFGPLEWIWRALTYGKPPAIATPA